MGFDLSVVRLGILRDSSVLERGFELRGTLTLRESKNCLTHPEACFDVAWVVFEDALTLIDNLVIVFLIELAHC